MYAAVPSATLVGVEALPVRVEAHLARGLPSTTIVGLPDAAVREARERVRAALASSGFEVPRSRILINLSPADLRKEGPALDLAIAVALLTADGRLPASAAAGRLCFAELALDGALRPVRGAIAMGLAALRDGPACVLTAPEDAAGLAALGGLDVWPARDLAEAVALLRGTRRPDPPRARPRPPEAPPPDLTDVRGRAHERHALEVAAAGGHALLMTGPPGTGKTMLAHRLPGLLPDLDRGAAVEVARIRSAAGLALGDGLPRRPPFRAPHHGITHVGLVGGGRVPRPGELSLAHRGVLFLDEVAEFSRASLEALRQPLEEGRIALDRHRARTVLPADVQLVAARNPCPCGWRGTEPPRCACHPADVRRYRGRVSGPLLDRIDLHVHFAQADPASTVSADPGEATAAVAARVAAARGLASERQGRSNARLGPDGLRRDVLGEPAVRARAAAVAAHLGLTSRGVARLLRVARTVADLDGRDRVGPQDVEVAAQYRSPDAPARGAAATG